MTRFKIALAACAMAAFAAPVALADVAALTALAERGQQALHGGSYAEASEIFSAGMQQAEREGDTEWLLRFRFYRGNARLVAAGDSAEPVPLARQAVRDYRAVLARRPESGAAMVNLARALVLLQQFDDAEAWYRKAIALDDDKQALYRQQYAEFLQQRNPEEAQKQLRAVLVSQPASRKAHQQLMQSYLDPRYASRLAEYLLAQIDKGEVLRAQQSAIEALANPGWPARYKGDLMNVIGVSLARQDIAPREFAASEQAGALRRVAAQDTTLRLCIDELMQTLERGAQPVAYSWWTADAERAETLGSLLRSLARSHAERGRSVDAERLYRRAIDVAGTADPKAVRDLVDFYATRGNVDAINDVASQYEFALFEGKGDAYARNDEKAIYDYHRSLAAIYANQAQRTGDWGSLGDATSAAFQLEHAYRTATRSGSITPDPQLVDQLAQSYSVTRGASEAVDLRLRAAADYQRSGNLRAAQTVLAPIEVQTLPAATRARYDRLQPALVAPPESNRLNDARDRLDPRVPAVVEPNLPVEPNVPAEPSDVERLDLSTLPNRVPGRVVPDATTAPVERALQTTGSDASAPARIDDRVLRVRPEVLLRQGDDRVAPRDEVDDLAETQRDDEGP